MKRVGSNGMTAERTTALRNCQLEIMRLEHQIPVVTGMVRRHLEEQRERLNRLRGQIEKEIERNA